MRSAILMGLVMFILVSCGAYGITWYGQAQATKRSVENLAAQLKAQNIDFTYEALETSGFPSTVNVTIRNPHFSGRIDTLANQFSEQAKKEGRPRPGPDPIYNPWQQDAQLTGTIILGVNALSDNYSMQIHGSWNSVSQVDGKTFTQTTSSNGGVFCSIQLARTGSIFDAMWNYESLNRDADAFLRDFRMFDCALPANTFTDSASKKILSSSGPARFYISSAPDAGNQHMRIYFNAADLEMTADGDELYTNLLQAFQPNKIQPRRLSLYGKQMIDIDFTYNGPSTLKDTSNPNIEISLGKFNISNAAYNTKLAFFLNNTTNNGVRQFKITLHGDSTFTPQYDIMMQEIVRAVIDEATTSADPRFMEFQATMNKYTPDQLYAIALPVLPNFNSLGHVVQSVDLEYTGDAEYNNGEATLHDLELSVTPYGIKGNGAVKRANGAQPEGQVNLTCNNCAQMIDDSMAYATRLNTAMMYFAPAQAAAMAPNPALAEGVKNFLTQVAGPDKTNLAFDIQSTPNGITINGKTMSAVTQRYFEYIVPALKQAEANQKRFSNRP